MLRNKYKQAKTKYELKKLAICISNVLYYQYMDLFDSEMLVLRSPISVQVIKKNLE